MSTAPQPTPSTEDPYPSRVLSEPRLIARQDPVVYGDAGDGPLDDAHLSRYEQHGFLVFEGLLNAEEVRLHAGELQRLRNDDALLGRPEVITEPESGQVRSIFAVHRQSELMDRLCRDRRIVTIARQLLGGDVYFHQTRVNYKSGFRGKEFYWHSDFETWHQEDGMPRMRAVSCSISLTDNSPHNGPLLLIPGSHREFLPCVGETPEDHYQASLKRQEYGVPDDHSLASMVERGGIEAATGRAGSVVFFECNVMHGSNSNITPWPRSNCFIVFNSVDNSLVDPYCGLAPRPPFIAERDDFSPVELA
jgi:ectoine hydroxylase